MDFFVFLNCSFALRHYTFIFGRLCYIAAYILIHYAQARKRAGQQQVGHANIAMSADAFSHIEIGSC